MPEDKFELNDFQVWSAAFSERLDAYQAIVNRQNKEREDAKARHAAELDEMRAKFAEALRQPQEALFEVAPIYSDEVTTLPTGRAAYSDRTAALMSKLAKLTYIGFEDTTKKEILQGLLKHGNVTLLETIVVDDTEAMIADTTKCVVVAFRGTASKGDVRTDVHARLMVNTVEIETRKVRVPVHSGFHAAYTKVRGPLIERLLATGPKEGGGKPIYLTGHSLGGALALVASADLGAVPGLGDRIAAVYTFGAPRVGKANFSEIVKAPHYRVVNAGDIVPLVPPNWLLGYRHTGMPMLLKKNANMAIRRAPFGSAGLFALFSVLLWPFTKRLRILDAHSTELYVANLDRIARYRGRMT